MQPQRRGRRAALAAAATVWLAGTTPPELAAASSDEVAALRAELAELRQTYEARIADLERRLASLEAPPAPLPSEAASQPEELDRLRRAAREAVKPAAEASDTPQAGAAVEAPAWGRERNLNRLNPEISVTGIVLANSSDRDREEFEAQEFELDLQSALDPFSRMRVTLALRESEIEIEEGYVLYSSLPGGLELLGGRFRQRFGPLNRQHRHALPQSDYPLVYQSFFGEEGLAQTGVSLGWLLPRPWASANSVTLEITNGENEAAFGGELFDDLSLLGRLTNFWELGAATYVEWGLTGVIGKTLEAGNSSIWGTDLSFQWRPPARAKYREVNWRTELLLSQRDDTLGDEQEAWGGYSYLEGLVRRNLYLGLRADRVEDPLQPGDYRWGLVPYLTWWQSEYVRLRAEYGYLKESSSDGSENRFTLQLTWAAGPHKHETY